MKTRPINDVLPLPLEPDSQAVMEVYYQAIHEMVCYGTHMFDWSLRKRIKMIDTNTEVDLAPSLLFRYIIEILDAISVQINAGINFPCKVQMRALLETSFSLEYMLASETKEKSGYYFIVDFYRKYNFYKKLIPKTEENKNYLQRIKKHDPDLYNVVFNKDATKDLKRMESLINNSTYQAAKAEYLKHTSNNTDRLNNLKWYSLNKGPNNVGALAENVKGLVLYDFLYKDWSNSSHGTELWSKTLTREDDGYGGIKQIRNLEEAQIITETTIVLGLRIYKIMGEKFLNKDEKNIKKWIDQFYKNHFFKVRKTKLDFKTSEFLEE